MARTKRFKRGEPLPMQVTARDRAILGAVARHRFLDSRQIIALFGGSAQQILRRLQRLFHGGYLERPVAQLRYFSETGSRPMVYAIGRLGNRLLNEDNNARRRPGNRVTQLYLEHTLLVAAVMLAFHRSERKAGAPCYRLDERAGQTGRIGTETARWAARWNVSIRHGGATHRLGIEPDKIVSVESGTKRPVLLFIEADRGTMPVARRSLKQSSFFRKLLAYEATWTQRLTKGSHGIERFRVLTVTASPARARHLAAACAQLAGGRGLFLFTDLESLQRAPDILAHDWLSGRGGEDRILGT